MDICLALEKLGLADQEWGPGGTPSSTYAELVAGWRGSVPVPTLAAMEAAWAEIQAAAAEPMTEEELREAVAALTPEECDRLLREILVERFRATRRTELGGVKLKKRKKP